MQAETVTCWSIHGVGNSFVSEFELLCGVNHTAFGRAGRAAPVIIAHFATRCFPQYLRSLGYETFAVYSTNGEWLNVRDVFRNYGIDKMYDAKDLGLSEAVAFAVQDRVFTNKLLEILNSPRKQPRFIWVSTN